MIYRKRISFLLVFYLISFSIFSQNPKLIAIETDHIALLYTVKKDGHLYQSYFGDKLLNQAENDKINGGKRAYTTGGMNDAFQPALRVTHADNNPSLDLIFKHVQTINKDANSHETIIELTDPKYAVSVKLHYQVFGHEDIINTWVEIINQEKSSLILQDYASSMLHVRAADYWLTQFHGDWAYEAQMEEVKLTSGIKEIDSKLGTRADMYQSPFFLISLDKPSDEQSGDVIAGTLAWTGNFRFHFEVEPDNSLRILSGINPYASSYQLEAGKTFKTPSFVFTFSSKGRGQASRNLHRWVRKYDLDKGEQPRKILFNNWETTRFNFNQEKILNLIGDASKLGSDIFLLDDGWFGNKYPRSNDNAALGDWVVTKEKIPSGIFSLVKESEKNGIKFGIWVEPEMVNPKSELYENHPDWILKLPNRDEDYSRNQLVLDLNNPAVQNFIFNTIDQMLKDNPGIAFFKWDCNRPMSNAWSPFLKNKQSNLYVDYVFGLYNILKRIKSKYPQLEMMLCSGGGARTDYEALKYFTEFWPSDDTDPVERVFIQWGYSYFFPANAIAAHITSWGAQSIKFKTDVAMMDKLGFDLDVHKLTPEDYAFVQQSVINYKRISPVIWNGDLYRLISPYEENRSVVMYVDSAKTNAILFNYNLNTRQREQFNRVKLQGLEPTSLYKIQEINIRKEGKPSIDENEGIFSGDFLLKVGLNLNRGDVKPLTSSIVEIKKIK